jgi:hypothetical protein
MTAAISLLGSERIQLCHKDKISTSPENKNNIPTYLN